MSYCPQCGRQNPDSVRFCSGCGAAVSLGQAADSASSKTGLRKGSKLAIVAVVAVIIVLAFGAFAYAKFFKPMSDREYEAVIEERVDAIVDEIVVAAEFWRWLDDDAGYYMDELYGEDWDSQKRRALDACDEAEMLLLELQDIKAPKSYESEHADLLELSTLVLEFVDEARDIIANAEGRDVWDVADELDNAFFIFDDEQDAANRGIMALEDILGERLVLKYFEYVSDVDY